MPGNCSRVFSADVIDATRIFLHRKKQERLRNHKRTDHDPSGHVSNLYHVGGTSLSSKQLRQKSPPAVMDVTC
jgi:hypothetical protein